MKDESYRMTVLVPIVALRKQGPAALTAWVAVYRIGPYQLAVRVADQLGSHQVAVGVADQLGPDQLAVRVADQLGSHNVAVRARTPPARLPCRQTSSDHTMSPSVSPTSSDTITGDVDVVDSSSGRT